MNRALELWPINAMALVQRSTLNVRRGDMLTARADIETALYIYNAAVKSGQMNPQDPKIQEALQLKNRWFGSRRRRLRRFN